MTTPGAASAFIKALAAEPGRTPDAAPDEMNWPQLLDRTRQQARPCARCKARAGWSAVIASPHTGNRYLDLCFGCAMWLSQNMITTAHAEQDKLADEAWLRYRVLGEEES
jgi:hypothetical protein